MKESRGIAVLCGLALLVVPGCSSSGGSSELSEVNAAVTQLLQVLNLALTELNPNPPPVSAARGEAEGGLAEECTPGCADVTPEQFCNEGGCVGDCSGGSFTLNQCKTTSPDGSVEVDGTLNYAPDAQWPSGSRLADVIVVAPSSEHWFYDMTFDGTEIVEIEVEDLLNGTLAFCLGNLETLAPGCELLPDGSI